MGLLTQLATNGVANRLNGVTTLALQEVVERRTAAVERQLESLRRRHPGLPPGQLAQKAVAERARLTAGHGLVSALPGVVPVVGTAVELGVAIGDVSLLTWQQAELVLLLAAIYGRDLADRPARRLDVLLALGLESGAVKLKSGGSVEVLGRRYGRDELQGVAADAVAARVNRRLAGQVTARLARRRAGVVLGREIPALGVGIAAGYNLFSTRRLGRSAIELFEHLV